MLLSKNEDRYKGSLIGLAVGDALGAPIEMSLPETFEEVQNMRGGGYFNLAPGEWTDDTALALCSAKSLIECRSFEPKDHLTRFLKWYREGYMSTRKEALGIGLVTAGALMRFESTGEDFCGPTGEKTAHNGSLMCLSPVVLAYAHNYEQTLHYAGEFSRLTHGAPVAVDACRYLAHCIVRALQGVERKEVPCNFEARTKEVREMVGGAYTQKPDITKENYADALTTLHGALWGLVTTDSFEEGVLKVVNLGWDANTTGAVYGQLAEALYGFDAIPKKWSNTIARYEEIVTSTQKTIRTIKRKGDHSEVISEVVKWLWELLFWLFWWPWPFGDAPVVEQQCHANDRHGKPNREGNPVSNTHLFFLSIYVKMRIN